MHRVFDWRVFKKENEEEQFISFCKLELDHTRLEKIFCFKNDVREYLQISFWISSF